MPYFKEHKHVIEEVSENYFTDKDIEILEAFSAVVKLGGFGLRYYKTEGGNYLLDVKEELYLTEAQFLAWRNKTRSQHRRMLFKMLLDTIEPPKTNPKAKRGSGHSAWATLVKLRDGECVQCGSKKHLEAHHIKPWKDHQELRLDVDNGQTLCKSCHKKAHHKKPLHTFF